MKTALTIAGSDSGGGAGIQADIKTMQANGVFAMSAVTALTAQNTIGIEAVFPVTPEFLERQLESVCSDILPAAVKIGMLFDVGFIPVIAGVLKKYQIKNVVLDPVLASTSGTALALEGVMEKMTEALFPLSKVVTPNIPEAERLTGMEIREEAQMERAAAWIGEKYGCNVLLKGGHFSGEANDYLWQKECGVWYRGRRIDNPNTHGTGCTLSSAVAAGLAKGYPLEEAVREAKRYLSEALAQRLDLGNGRGPLCHAWKFM